MGSLLQSLMDARDSSGPVPPAIIQALENARDHRPVAAGDTSAPGHIFPSAADETQVPVIASASAANTTTVSANDARSLALVSPSYASETELPALAFSPTAGEAQVPTLVSQFDLSPRYKAALSIPISG